MMHVCVMHVKNGDGQTNGKLNSRSRIYLLSLILIHVCMMCTHVCTMYTCVYDVHTYDVRMVFMVHISMILVFDLGTCMYDARN